MNTLKVNLWGEEIGRLSWKPNIRQCYFIFNPELKGSRPDVAPLTLPLKRWSNYQTAYGDDRRIYQHLPPFIADSLPDSWGNKLFEQWAKLNRLSPHNISPLYKLMFIGKRGMGALEYMPAATDLDHKRPVDVKALYDLSLKISDDRKDVSILPEEELTLQTLLNVGTSAGGRQMKAILAIDKETGEIRSGQVDGLENHEYCLLKFEDIVVPSSEIEMAYYEMATMAGIDMEECRLLKIDGVYHFLTKRFDRKNGEKIHMQTLAAIHPDATSYEELFAVCRELELTGVELDNLYRRMVFNVMANNTDDHNKNFSFLLERGGRWRISPAYDITFIFNRFGTGPEVDRCLSIGGKFRGISKDDLLRIGKDNGIRNPDEIIDNIADVLKSFPMLADKYGIDPRWGNIIKSTLRDNLNSFGYGVEPGKVTTSTDRFGRVISDVGVKIIRTGNYEVSVIIDGLQKRRFVRPNMALYRLLATVSFRDLPIDNQLSIIEELFPG